jgi:predicted membrane protein (TIGR00267 family)
MSLLKRIYEKFRKYIQTAEAGEIARRYFVMNAFDGAFTLLGIIMGAYVVGAVEPKLIVSAGLSASLAMGISGAWGAYMAERAERARSLKELETAMLADLSESTIYRAFKMAAFWVAFIDGLSPIAASIFGIIPFILASLQIISTEAALLTSMVLIMVILFILGVFTGRMSKGSIILHGSLWVAVGLITSMLILFISYLLK